MSNEQSPVPVREYRYEPLPAEPKGTECEVCGSTKLGRIWIHAEVEIRMPLYVYRTSAPLLCSRCNEELRDHIRRFAEALPPPFHGRKIVAKAGAEGKGTDIGATLERVLDAVSGRVE